MRICGNRTKGEAFRRRTRAREPDERLVTAGAPRVTVTPLHTSAGPPATLSHDAMAARRLSPLAGAATRALGVRPRHLQRQRLA